MVPLIAGLVPSAGPVERGLVAATGLKVEAGLPISSTPGQGLWLVTRAGRVLALGDAHSYGDAHAGTPVVGMAATPDGRGYWMATAGGGVYSFGDAGRFGSLGGAHLASPVVGIAATANGKGYWLATRAGAVYGFGDATVPGPGDATVLPAPAGPGPRPGGGHRRRPSDGGLLVGHLGGGGAGLWRRPRLRRGATGLGGGGHGGHARRPGVLGRGPGRPHRPSGRRRQARRPQRRLPERRGGHGRHP